MNITANLSTAEKMSFEKAIKIVHRCVEIHALKAEHDAEYYGGLNPDPENFSHAFAAEEARKKALDLREAFEVVMRGY